MTRAENRGTQHNTTQHNTTQHNTTESNFLDTLIVTQSRHSMLLRNPKVHYRFRTNTLLNFMARQFNPVHIFLTAR